jgi:hypothetical protein
MNSTATGLSAVVSGSGTRLSSIRKGTAGTRMSPASVRWPDAICTAAGSLRKLGVCRPPWTQAWAAALGSVAQVAVMPDGAGTKVEGKPATAIVAGPGGSPVRTRSRCPLAASIGTASGSTATQQRNPASDSKTNRTVLTEAGRTGPNPPSFVAVPFPVHSVRKALRLAGCCQRARSDSPPSPPDEEPPPHPANDQTAAANRTARNASSRSPPFFRKNQPL